MLCWCTACNTFLHIKNKGELQTHATFVWCLRSQMYRKFTLCLDYPATIIFTCYLYIEMEFRLANTFPPCFCPWGENGEYCENDYDVTLKAGIQWYSLCCAGLALWDYYFVALIFQTLGWTLGQWSPSALKTINCIKWAIKPFVCNRLYVIYNFRWA